MKWREVAAEFGRIVGSEHAHSQASKNELRVNPGAISEISDVVRLAAAKSLPVFPVGRERFESDPRTEPTVVLGLQRMNQIVRLDEHSMVVTAQAGITGDALENVLNRRGLTMGAFPKPMIKSSLGGLLAVRTAGKASPRLGFLEESILGLSAVLPDGRVIHSRTIPPHATGPDPRAVFYGSRGAMGILASVSIGIRQLGETSLEAGFSFQSLRKAIRAAYLALREEAKPDQIEIWCHHKSGVAQTNLLLRSCGVTDLASCDRDLFMSAASAEEGEPLDEAEVRLWEAGEAPYHAGPAGLYASPSGLLAICDGLEGAVAETDGAICRIARIDARGGTVSLGRAPSDAQRVQLQGCLDTEGVGPALSEDPMDEYTSLLREDIDAAGVLRGL